MVDAVLGSAGGDFDVQLYGLSAVVYAERGDEILLLRRQAGALSGQWFLPGGAVERGELPEDGARRELELVGAYPIWVYGGDGLQLSYRAPVRDGDVVVSDEHSAARWVDPVAMRASMSDDVIDALADDDERVATLVRRIRADLDHYLRRVGPHLTVNASQVGPA
jgi:hypothetical protein